MGAVMPRAVIVVLEVDVLLVLAAPVADAPPPSTWYMLLP